MADPNVYDEYGRTPIHHLLEEEWGAELKEKYIKKSDA
ncbi:conserved hypothetical protein [delta proteobacterium NaphS2]|nr:conserved hypothetical protein [delta proteobacterium NaphS2]